MRRNATFRRRLQALMLVAIGAVGALAGGTV